MASDSRTEVRAGLTEPQTAAVLALTERAAETDGVGPLSEHALLHVRYGGDPAARDVLLWQGDDLAGYGHLDPAGNGADADGAGDDQAGEVSGEMLIDPGARRRGLGLSLVRALAGQAGGRELRLWAHGDLPAAAALAAVAGFSRTRSLYQLRRPLADPLPEARVPDGVTIRTFRVGQDEDEWIRVNAAAFAHHPEQGAWTRADLEVREREPWFDPAGFFLAERAGRLAGFHWTKVEDGVGEVYVVGVDPAGQGGGLGRALTLIGLHYLRDRGLAEVMLYVDGENTPAVRLYESLGFTRAATDVMYSLAGSVS